MNTQDPISKMYKPTILHIEDDAANRLLVRKLLTSQNMHVVDAETGLEGVRKALEIHPDLVLIDLNIPDLDGYEVALRLHSDPALLQTPLVAITAEGDRDTSLAVGFVGFIQKPIQASVFANEVRAYLAGKRERPSPTSDHRLRIQSGKIVRHLEEKVAELIATNDRLRAIDQLRKEFYRNLSHELATPLTPIVGYLSMLLNEELGPLNKSQSKALRAMNDCTYRLRSLIENLLDVTGFETGRIQFTHKSYDFLEVVKRALSLETHAIEDHQIRLIQDFPEGPLPALGDGARLQRAIQQIFNNARKFAGQHGTIGVRVRTPSPEHYELYVADSGPGIPEAAMDRIFEPFFQADGSPTRQFGGAGLGLALAKHIVQGLGGEIRVLPHAVEPIQNVPLHGAAFYLVFAQHAPQEWKPQ